MSRFSFSSNLDGERGGIYSIIWALTSPVRLYVHHSPVRKGKGLLIRKIWIPVRNLGPEEERVTLENGVAVRVRWKEEIGRALHIYGDFEPGERRYFLRLAEASSGTFLDVGANIGLFTTTLAKKLSNRGRVIAVEPEPTTASRLRANVAANGLDNVEIVEAAAGAEKGTAVFHVSHDSAYGSLDTPRSVESHELNVDVVRMDDVWVAAGKPHVFAMKVDVEGRELDVLKGSVELLRECRPVVLAETRVPELATTLVEWMHSQGYDVQPQPGFMFWNSLFVRRTPHSNPTVAHERTEAGGVRRVPTTEMNRYSAQRPPRSHDPLHADGTTR
jgi:FkbM family methyltransferase